VNAPVLCMQTWHPDVTNHNAMLVSNMVRATVNAVCTQTTQKTVLTLLTAMLLRHDRMPCLHAQLHHQFSLSHHHNQLPIQAIPSMSCMLSVMHICLCITAHPVEGEGQGQPGIFMLPAPVPVQMSGQQLHVQQLQGSAYACGLTMMTAWATVNQTAATEGLTSACMLTLLRLSGQGQPGMIMLPAPMPVQIRGEQLHVQQLQGHAYYIYYLLHTSCSQSHT
jgi:hypothetical protein